MLLRFTALNRLARLGSIPFLALLLGVTKMALHAAPIDTVVFGDAASESAHALAAPSTEVLTGALGQSARRALPFSPADIYGG